MPRQRVVLSGQMLCGGLGYYPQNTTMILRIRALKGNVSSIEHFWLAVLKLQNCVPHERRHVCNNVLVVINTDHH